MNDPTCSAYLKGICGDEMEFYLVIEDGRITEIKAYTQGCEFTRLCAQMTASLAEGKTVIDALGISAGKVISEWKNLPEENRHCAILAVSALYRAIADYLLKS